MSEKRLFTVDETSAILNLSKWFLYRLVEEKKIKHVRLGKKILFSEKQLDQIIEENTVDIRDY
jgi:excisionase family DNA binding protein